MNHDNGHWTKNTFKLPEALLELAFLCDENFLHNVYVHHRPFTLCSIMMMLPAF